MSLLEETEFSTNCSESWNSVSKLPVVSKPSLWQLLIQLKAEDASMKAKMMAITASGKITTRAGLPEELIRKLL